MSAKIPFVVYVHVEKAGGISINNMLHNYIKGYISPSPRWGETMRAEDLQIIQKYYPLKIKGIGGHRIVAKEKYSSDQFVFAFVREPLSRLLSHLNWQINKMDIPHTFESFINDIHFQNFQTFRLTRSRDFQTAKTVIEKYYNFIGLSEQYDLSINLLSKKLYGQVEKLNYEKMNETKKRNKTYRLQDLDEKQIKHLKKLNQVDIDLYNYIRDEVFPTYYTNDRNYHYQPSNAKTPTLTTLKRKLSNYYVGRVLQPQFMKQVKFGY